MQVVPRTYHLVPHEFTGAPSECQALPLTCHGLPGSVTSPPTTCQVVPLTVLAGHIALHPLPTTCTRRPRALHFCRVHVNRDRVRGMFAVYLSPLTENLSSPAD